MANDLLEKRRDQVFPKLTSLQIARLEAHGNRIDTRAGDVLVEPGDPHRKLLVVLSGSLEIALPGMLGEALLTVLLPGDFTGEMSTLRGVPGFVRVRVREDGAVLAVDERSLRDVVQTDAELSEILSDVEHTVADDRSGIDPMLTRAFEVRLERYCGVA